MLSRKTKVLAIFLLGTAIMTAAVTEGYAQSQAQIDAWEVGASQGDAKAEANLGYMYQLGRVTGKSDADAVIMWRKAAEQGNLYAQQMLAEAYHEGRGVGKDDKEAAKWWRMAADQSSGQQKIILNQMAESASNPEAAIAHLRVAAEQGDADAQFKLGYAYQKGNGVPQDDQQAVSWFRKSAAQGNSWAQLNLGIAYQKGWGVEKDDKQAVEWFRKAADQNNTLAEANLGFAYINGVGVEKDRDEGIKWIRKQMEQTTHRHIDAGSIQVNSDTHSVQVNAVPPMPEAPLVQAAASGNLPRVKELIESGANINMQNNTGMTALMWAAATGQTEIVKYLLQNRADPSLTNTSGYTALTLARRNHREDIIPLLEQAKPVVSSSSRGASTLGSFIRLLVLLGPFFLRSRNKKNAEKKKADSRKVDAAPEVSPQSAIQEPVQSLTDPVMQQRKQSHIVTAALRLSGAMFIVTGIACYYDLGGISSAIGLHDSATKMIIGGVFFALGIFNYLVLPAILDKRGNSGE